MSASADVQGMATLNSPTSPLPLRFENRGHAFEAACRQGFDRLQDQIERAWRKPPTWPSKVATAIATALEFAVAEPLTASLLLVETVASGATGSGHYYEWLDRLAPALRPGRRERPEAGLLPASTEQTLLGGLGGLIGQRLHGGQPASLPALAPQLTEFALTPYLGTAQAKHHVADFSAASAQRS